MNLQVYISVDALLLEEANLYAAKNNLTLSQLIEEGLTKIIRNPQRDSFLQLLDKLPASQASFPDDFDFKRAYYEERKEKYGFGNQ